MKKWSFRNNVFACLISLIITMPVTADTYQPSNTTQSYTTLLEAETAMRAVDPDAALLQFDRISSETATQIVRFYTVPTVDHKNRHVFDARKLCTDDSWAWQCYGFGWQYLWADDLEMPIEFSTFEEALTWVRTGNSDSLIFYYEETIFGGQHYYYSQPSKYSPTIDVGATNRTDMSSPLRECDSWTTGVQASRMGSLEHVMYGPLNSFPTGTRAILNNCELSDKSWWQITSVPVVEIMQREATTCSPPYTLSENQCTNSTTASITQTCTDGIPLIKPLGSNPQLPSIWTNRTSKPSTQDYEVSVKSACNAIISNANVMLSYSGVPFSGGHIHQDANRPNGIFNVDAINYMSEQSGISPLTVNTGASGTIIVKYTAPQASGQTKVTMTCILPDGAACESRDENINVGIDGLLRMGAGGNYDIVDRAATAAVHPESHFVTPLLKQAIS